MARNYAKALPMKAGSQKKLRDVDQGIPTHSGYLPDTLGIGMIAVEYRAVKSHYVVFFQWPRSKNNESMKL